MVALALPFAYLHARAGGVSFKVFGGIMLGISFVLLNNLAGHIGVLRDWTPWVVAATPERASTCCCRWRPSPGWCVTVETHEPRETRPDPRSPMARATRAGRCPSRPWPRACARRGRACRCGWPILEFMAPNLPDAGAELAAAGCTRIEVRADVPGRRRPCAQGPAAAAGRAARRPPRAARDAAPGGRRNRPASWRRWPRPPSRPWRRSRHEPAPVPFRAGGRAPPAST